MAEQIAMGISIDIEGYITRACRSCGGVTDPSSDSPDKCECGGEPEIVPVTARIPWPSGVEKQRYTITTRSHLDG